MSTTSRIGIINTKDKTIKSVYCHWDGYPEHNGEILAKNYTKRTDVEALIEMGNMSSLAGDISECVFFGRDRGEDGQDADICNSLSETDGFTEAYFYVMDETDQWCVSKYPHHLRNPFVSLNEVIKEVTNRKKLG